MDDSDNGDPEDSDDSVIEDGALPEPRTNVALNSTKHAAATERREKLTAKKVMAAKMLSEKRMTVTSVAKKLRLPFHVVYGVLQRIRRMGIGEETDFTPRRGRPKILDQGMIEVIGAGMKKHLPSKVRPRAIAKAMQQNFMFDRPPHQQVIR